MATTFLKKRLLDLYRNNVLPRIEALHAEQIYQGIFTQQCRAHAIDDVFYPVGAAASYSLLYLLTRALTELPVKAVVELGSGQTTVLIDRLLRDDSTHVAYEQDAMWAERINARIKHARVLHSPLAPLKHEGVSFNGLSNVKLQPFDLLLVDGPNGTDHHSRYNCMPLVTANAAREFMIVIDDADRPGEQETIRDLSKLLQGRGIDFKLNYLHGRNAQAVVTTPAYRAASYYF